MALGRVRAPPLHRQFHARLTKEIDRLAGRAVADILALVRAVWRGLTTGKRGRFMAASLAASRGFLIMSNSLSYRQPIWL